MPHVDGSVALECVQFDVPVLAGDVYIAVTVRDVDGAAMREQIDRRRDCADVGAGVGACTE